MMSADVDSLQTPVVQGLLVTADGGHCAFHAPWTQRSTHRLHAGGGRSR